MIVLGGSNIANDEKVGYVAMTLFPTGVTAMDTNNITINPTMTVANGVPKVSATVSIPSGTLTSGINRTSGSIDKSELVETKNVTANGTYSANDKLWNQIVVNVPNSGSDVAIQGSKTAILSTTDSVIVTPDTGYDAMARVVVPKVLLEERSVTLTSSQTLTPSGSNLGFSKVNVTVNASSEVKNQTKTVKMPTNGTTLQVEPDAGYTGLSLVTVHALSLQDKSVTLSTTSEQTIKVDAGQGYHGLKSVTVPKVQLETLSVTPSASVQTFTPSGSNLGFSQVTVAAAASGGATALNAYYVGTTEPDASLGNDGDIYLKT